MKNEKKFVYFIIYYYFKFKMSVEPMTIATLMQKNP